MHAGHPQQPPKPSPDPARVASCSCGALRVSTQGEPVRVSICHCRACQRRTGSVFGAQARFPVSRVAVEGTSSTWTRVGDDGGRLTFHFCPRCGATVYFGMDTQPDLVGVPVGAFADPAFPPPHVSVYEEFQHPWACVPEGAVRER